VRIAEWLVAEGAFATQGIDQRLTEVGGSIEIASPAGPFLLTARADRIDIAAGTAVIYDYKTGTAPSEKQMASGLKPQMPLEAAMLSRGAFTGLDPTPAADLVYMRLTGGPVAGARRGLAKNSADALGERAWEGLGRWIARFCDPRTPYPPREIPEREAWPGDYDHLSRYAEWSRTGADTEAS
jgi:ATP-dependent helicase/nuclease subunit B